MMLVFLLVGLLGLSLAARQFARWRGRRLVVAEARRDSFTELLAQAERERLAQQIEAEGDEIPWR